jgi:ankyrin repeat protein
MVTALFLLIFLLLLLLVIVGGGRVGLPLWLIAFVVTGCSRPVPPRPVNRAVQLVAAVRSDSAAVVQDLLDAGVSPDTVAPDGSRPLTEAARHGRIAAARVLLGAGARLDLADSSGTRPFDYAIEEGHRAIAMLLTREAARDAGANGAAMAWFDSLASDRSPAHDWRRFLDGEIASLGVMAAVLARREDAVTALRHAAGIPNRTSYAALAIAARFGDEVAVADLLQASVNPDAEVSGHRHETPLMEAARDGYAAIARRLVRAGARIDHVDSAGETALIWAVRAGETDYARALLDAGANPGWRDLAGQTALDIARDAKHADLIALLEAHAKRVKS